MEDHMTLHQNRELFSEVVIQTAQMMGLPEVYIEKDYWVMKCIKKEMEVILGEKLYKK